MQDKEQWIRLGEQAHVEQDPARLLELIREIERLLGEKAERLKRQKTDPQSGRNLRSGC